MSYDEYSGVDIGDGPGDDSGGADGIIILIASARVLMTAEQPNGRTNNQTTKQSNKKKFNEEKTRQTLGNAKLPPPHMFQNGNHSRNFQT
jgi:hypothetical protein